MAYPNPTSPHIRDAGGAALWAILDGDGIGLDEALNNLGPVDLLELKDGVQLLLETVDIQIRVRPV